MTFHEKTTTILSVTALIISILIGYAEYIYKSSELKSSITFSSVKFLEDKKLWVLTYNIAFLNTGDYSQLVRNARIVMLKDNKLNTSTNPEHVFNPLILKPGEILNTKLQTYICRDHINKKNKKPEELNVSNLIMSFQIVDSNGKIFYSGHNIGDVNSTHDKHSSGIRVSRNNLLFDLRSNGDIKDPYALLSESGSSNCLGQKGTPPLYKG